MPMITAMPSPRGTNHERLFILRGRKSANPQAAYDAMPLRLKTAGDGKRYGRQWLARSGMAYDLELPDSDENERQNEVDEADAKVEESINEITEWCKNNLSHIDIKKLVGVLLDHAGAMDSQPRSSGMSRVAQDERRRTTGMSAAERLSIEAICPGISRIKVL
jgi:hypothetical protein